MTNRAPAKEQLYKAIQQGDLDSVKEWVKFVNKSKKYPLHWNDDSMKAFQKRWWNWLHYASYFNKLDIVKYFVEEVKIDINIQTILIVNRNKYYWDDTALHISAREGNTEITCYLLEAGIKKEMKNYEGKKAFEVTKNKEMVELIKKFKKGQPAKRKSKHERSKSGKAEKVVEEQTQQKTESEKEFLKKRDLEMQDRTEGIKDGVSSSSNNNDAPPSSAVVASKKKEEKPKSSSIPSSKSESSSTSFEKERKAFEMQLEKKDQTIKDYQNMIAQYRNEIEQFEMKLNEANHKIEKKEEDNKNLMKEVFEKQGDAMELKKYMEKVHLLKTQHEEDSDLLSTYEEEKNQAFKNIERLQKEIETYKPKYEKFDIVERENKELKKENEELRTRANDIESKVGWEGMKKHFEEHLDVVHLKDDIEKIEDLHLSLNNPMSPRSPPSSPTFYSQNFVKVNSSKSLVIKKENLNEFRKQYQEFIRIGEKVNRSITQLEETIQDSGFLQIKQFFIKFIEGEDEFMSFIQKSSKSFHEFERMNRMKYENSVKVEELFKEYKKMFKQYKKFQRSLKKLKLELEEEEDDDDDDDDFSGDSDDEENGDKREEEKKRKKEERFSKIKKEARQKEIECFELKRSIEGCQHRLLRIDCFDIFRSFYLHEIYRLNFRRSRSNTKFVDYFRDTGVLMFDRSLSDYEDLKLIYSNHENRIYEGRLIGSSTESLSSSPSCSTAAGGRKVVIKVLPFEKEQEKAVVNEITTMLNLLRHESIISLHCIFQFQEYNRRCIGIEMENVEQDYLHWLKGMNEQHKEEKEDDDSNNKEEEEEENLKSLVRMENQQSMKSIQRVLYKLVEGIAFIHSKGMIHRDLKPQNILIPKGKECVKIIDFGISQNENSNFITKMGNTDNYSTPRYKCPENEVSSASDIYSFGLMLFETLCASFDVVDYEGTLPKGIKGDEKDLLEKVLEQNPKKRITAEEILKHPFFETIRKEEEEKEKEKGKKEGEERKEYQILEEEKEGEKNVQIVQKELERIGEKLKKNKKEVEEKTNELLTKDIENEDFSDDDDDDTVKDMDIAFEADEETLFTKIDDHSFLDQEDGSGLIN